jgi:hypothetical protein
VPNRPLLFVLLFGLLSGTAVAQPPAENLQTDPPFPQFSPSALVMTGFERVVERPAPAQGGFREAKTGFFLQQARLKLEGDLNKQVRLNLSVDLADAIDPALSGTDLKSPPYLRNAFINVRVVPELQFKVGRFKRPFSRLELTGAEDLPVRGRGLHSQLAGGEGQWGDRALGLSVHGRIKPIKLRWELAAMDPAWAPDVRREGVDAFARLTYDPLKWLSLGMAGGYKRVALTERTISVKAGTVDIEVIHDRLYALATAQLAQLPFETGTPSSFAFIGMASYDIPITTEFALQPAGFFEYADAHGEYLQTEAIRIVAGLNGVFFDQLRVMPQVELVNPLGTVSEYNPWVAKTAYYLLFSLKV